MRSIVCSLFILFSISSFSQTKEIKVSKKTLQEARELSDIITDIPKDCKVQSYVASFKTSSANLATHTCITNFFSTHLSDLLLKEKKGYAVFIENIKSGCGKAPSGRYKITLE